MTSHLQGLHPVKSNQGNPSRAQTSSDGASPRAAPSLGGRPSRGRAPTGSARCRSLRRAPHPLLPPCFSIHFFKLSSSSKLVRATPPWSFWISTRQHFGAEDGGLGLSSKHLRISLFPASLHLSPSSESSGLFSCGAGGGLNHPGFGAGLWACWSVTRRGITE